MWAVLARGSPVRQSSAYGHSPQADSLSSQNRDMLLLAMGSGPSRIVQTYMKLPLLFETQPQSLQNQLDYSSHSTSMPRDFSFPGWHPFYEKQTW
jgi:hypothetical protein